MNDLKFPIVVILISILILYSFYSVGKGWYECEKNKGQYVKSPFGYTCILPK